MGFHHPIRNRAPSLYLVVFGNASAHAEIIYTALPGSARAPEERFGSPALQSRSLVHLTASIGHCHQQLIGSLKAGVMPTFVLAGWLPVTPAWLRATGELMLPTSWDSSAPGCPPGKRGAGKWCTSHRTRCWDRGSARKARSKGAVF